MFLKINSNNKAKKIVYPQDIKSIAKLIELVSDALKKHPDTFCMYYMDNDGEKMFLRDDHDFDYFDQNFGTQKIREIFVDTNKDDFLEMSFQHITEHVEDECTNLPQNNKNQIQFQEKQQSIINDQNNKIQSLEQQIEELQQKQKYEVQELMRKNEEQNAKYENSLKDSEDKLAKFEQQILEKQQQEDKLNEELQQKQTNIEETKIAQQKKEKIYEQEKAKMKIQIDELNKELMDLRNCLNDLSIKFEETNNKLQDYQQVKVQLEEQIQQQNQKMQIKEHQMVEKSQKIKLLQNNIDEYLQLIKELEQKDKQQNKKIDDAQKEIQNLREEWTKDIKKQKEYIKIQDEQIKVLERKASHVNNNELNNSQLIPQKKEQNICNLLEESNFSLLDQNYVQKDEVNKLNESFQQMQSQLSFFMEQMEKGQNIKKSLNSSVINQNITCSECHQLDFMGKRYLCMYCKDFNICDICEQKNNHPHLMIRIHGNENDPLLEFVLKKIQKYKDQKNKKVSKKQKKKVVEKDELHSKLKLIEFVYGPSQNEAQSTIRTQFAKQNIDKELEDFHQIIVNNKKMFEQIN